jgi:hypothetical protein
LVEGAAPFKAFVFFVIDDIAWVVVDRLVQKVPALR